MRSKGMRWAKLLRPAALVAWVGAMRWRAPTFAQARFAPTELARGVALAIGCVLLLEAGFAWFGEVTPRSLWLGLRSLSAPLAVAWLALLGAPLSVWGASQRGARFARAACVLLALHAGFDALRAWPITGPFSFSFLLAFVAALVGFAVSRDRRRAAAPTSSVEPPSRLVRTLHLGAGCAIALVALPLAQIGASARADYTRPAEAVVVLGARVYPDGRPSLALYDRTRTGAELVCRGLADKLVLSGGPGDRGVHETDAMKRVALELGVAESKIVIDRDGLTTAHTSRHTRSLLTAPDASRPPRVLVVSHGYHLARTRLAMHDAGVVAYTVPARETRPLLRLPYFVAREVAAFWVYWLTGS
jgi:uncharacterized SAM-binding protein YcdF (DUF218 family)